MPATDHPQRRRGRETGPAWSRGGSTLPSVVVLLLISLVVVLVAIVVVVRLLLAELARTAAYRQQNAGTAGVPGTRSVQPMAAKAGVSATASSASLAVGPPPGGAAGSVLTAPPPPVGDDVEPIARRREVERAVRPPWWRRLRSGTALVLLVALLGTATAGVVGAIALFIAFVFDQALR